MSIHKLRDWSSWWDGLRSKAMQAGAESVAMNLTAMLGSNGVASMIPALHDYALSWKTALVTTASQFVLRTILAASKYVAEKPDADVVVEETTTTLTSTKTTTQTPSQPVAPTDQ
jgi:hypothetical protein